MRTIRNNVFAIFQPLVLGWLAVLLLAPVPLHYCQQSGLTECTCCCAHDGAEPASSCCADPSAGTPIGEPACCITLDLDTGPVVHQQQRTELCVLPVLTFRLHHNVFLAPQLGVRFDLPTYCRTPSQRLAALCSFLI